MTTAAYRVAQRIGQALGVAFGAGIAAAYSWRDAFVALGSVGLAGCYGKSNEAGPAVASMLVYVLMAAVLYFRPSGLFPARG